MHRELTLTDSPIDEARGLETRAVPPTTGAVLVFVGTVRGEEQAKPIAGLLYTAFREMAEHQFHKLFDELEARWPRVESVRLVHRLGPVRATEPSLWVELRSPHRGEAFAACQWLIDEMKRVVPIWKDVMP